MFGLQNELQTSPGNNLVRPQLDDDNDGDDDKVKRGPKKQFNGQGLVQCAQSHWFNPQNQGKEQKERKKISNVVFQSLLLKQEKKLKKHISVILAFIDIF